MNLCQTGLGWLLLAGVLSGWLRVGAAAAPPPVQREFRGAWVATVKNIDWPSRPGLSTEQQQQELLAILDRAVALKLNAIIFQVRPACDALYASRYEPWSEYLTGKMGRAPEPYYDPLEFAIRESHRRGLELHAWFNPFRAKHPSASDEAAPSHLSRTRPDLVKAYGPYRWLDPGEKEAQQHSLDVILDVVRRYDVDGIHLDDYFYPYKIRSREGELIDFPDERSWSDYVRKGGKLSRDERRRESINFFIRTLYSRIKKEKRWVKFGISPFGIWRPGYPEDVKGLDTYAHLYADSRKWLRNGWLDYFAPQLYWPIEPPAQSYPALLGWWTGQNVKERHIWPGNNSAKVSGAWKPEEIVRQIDWSRRLPSTGHIHWNMSSLMGESALARALMGQTYRTSALPPAFPWLDSAPPAKPRVSTRLDRRKGALDVRWQAGAGESVGWWVLQWETAERWRTEIVWGDSPGRRIAWKEDRFAPRQVAVTAVDRCGNGSPPWTQQIR